MDEGQAESVGDKCQNPASFFKERTLVLATTSGFIAKKGHGYSTKEIEEETVCVGEKVSTKVEGGSVQLEGYR